MSGWRRLNEPWRVDSAALAAVFLALGCRQAPATAAVGAPSAEACERDQSALVAFLEQLPELAVVSGIVVALPESTLGSAPGSGPVLQLDEGSTYVDGSAVTERGAPERARRVAEWFERSRSAQPAPQKTTLYVAASAATDVQTLRAHLAAIPPGVELRLLVRTLPPSSEAARTTSSAAQVLAASLLAERDAKQRERIAARGYAQFSECDAVASAVASLANTAAASRWPALRARLLTAVPRCACDELDAPALKQLVAAEQRAGAAALGWLPFSFVRDERCGASMPLRSIGKLVRQIEGFDAEFAGGWQKDALRFEEVLGDERLLGYFCNALPGETLGARQRARATLYWRAPSSAVCHAWRFEPLATGAPMGTWRRVAGADPLAFHYWQAAEEIRVFGPVSSAAPSKPTDERAWECQQNYRLLDVDAESIRTDAGTWYLSEDTCRRAAPEPEAIGCVRSLAFPSVVPAPSTRRGQPQK